MAALPRKKKYDVESSFAEGSIKRLYLENFVYVVVAMLMFDGRNEEQWVVLNTRFGIPAVGNKYSTTAPFTSTFHVCFYDEPFHMLHGVILATVSYTHLTLPTIYSV